MPRSTKTLPRGLRRVDDAEPGIRRVRIGKSFTYANARGKAVRDAATLERIRSLVIPPAWRDVWICARADGHIQATGIDAKSRKQYRYHPLWRRARDLAKYYRMVPFAYALPRIRQRVDADLSSKGLPRSKVLAAVVRLLEESLIRIGNEEYAEANHSYGLTTMRDAQVRIRGAEMEFRFRGKSGKRHDVHVRDMRIASVVARCKALPGDEIFQYVDDDGKRHDVKADDVNAYLHEISGHAFTAKDFRTWAGTVHAALYLHAAPLCSSVLEAKRTIVRAIEDVARRLGNTPAVCRKSYVHPVILDRYIARTFALATGKRKQANNSGLTLGETAVLAFLERCVVRA